MDAKVASLNHENVVKGVMEGKEVKFSKFLLTFCEVTMACDILLRFVLVLMGIYLTLSKYLMTTFSSFSTALPL